MISKIEWEDLKEKLQQPKNRIAVLKRIVECIDEEIPGDKVYSADCFPRINLELAVVSAEEDKHFYITEKEHLNPVIPS